MGRRSVSCKPAPSRDFGFIDTKGNVHAAQDEMSLPEGKAIHARGVDLVWTPDSDRLLVPEEIPALHSPLRVRIFQTSRAGYQ